MPPEIINYIFTFIQSNTNKIMKDHIYNVENYELNKESNLYYVLCLTKYNHKYRCSLCNETNIPNSFKLYYLYDNKLHFFRYHAYELMFCSEVCLDTWFNY